MSASTTDRLAVVISECSRMGIKILAPDVNHSSLHFTPEKSGDNRGIRFGLASIKNVGGAAMETSDRGAGKGRKNLPRWRISVRGWMPGRSTGRFWRAW